MLTLPSDLTGRQRREIDVAVHRILHPEQAVEWQAIYPDGSGDWMARIDAQEAEGVEAWQPIPSYTIPGPANEEIERAMVEAVVGRELNTSCKGGEWLALLVESDGMFGNFIASGYCTTPSAARVACFMDWKGISIMLIYHT